MDPIAKTVLRTVIQLREIHRMNWSGAELICKSVYEILELFVAELEEQTTRGRPDLKSVIKREGRQIILREPLKDVCSEYKIMKCLKKSYGLIEPQEIKLGDIQLIKVMDQSEEIIDSDIFGMIVPMEKQLAQLLKNKEYFKYCFESPVQQSVDNIIRNIKDGSVYKNHPICQRYQNSLLLQLYEDDVEIVNPLGSHTKTHKITAVYWSILNLPDHVRSDLKSLHLQGFAKAIAIKSFGFQDLLDDFLKCITKLESEEGLDIDIGGGQILNIHGTLMSVAGDGLAMNALGGFKEGIGFANKPCRNCDLSKDELHSKFTETKLRDLDTHRKRLRELTSESLKKTDREKLSAAYGICGNSPFSNLIHFDITKCLPQDLMHTLLEGVAEVEIRALLFDLIEEKKLISFQDLNTNLSAFPYPLEFSGCKPSPIERNHVVSGKLRQNAAQMSCLLYILPFILEPLATGPSYECIANFSLLGKIANVLLAYEVDRSEIPLLRFMIVSHHTLYSKLYSQFPMTPKFHFLIHSPSVIEQFGPSRLSWTMRYEALNASVSRICQETKNFRNIVKTLATRFQVRKCLDYDFGNPDATVLGTKTFTPEAKFTVNLSNYRLGEQVSKQLSIKADASVSETKAIYINNYHIKVGSIILIENNENLMPKFGEVKTIFVADHHCAFVLQVFDTIQYNQITNSYEVMQTNRFTTVGHLKIPFLHPLPCIKRKGNISIILQYHSRTEYFGI